MMKTSEEILKLVTDYMASLPYNRQPARLYDPIRYVLSMGGKRIRPSLMLMAYNLFKDDPQTVLPQACALETFHNFTLLHDDLMDNADMRRGHQTVHRRWDANTAILSGDTMLIMAFQRMMLCPESLQAPVMRTFIETTLQINEGQQMDIDFETRDDVREEEYIEMIRLKTSILLACALKIGAIMAGAPADDIDRLYRFGERMGLAFQLQDDFLDVYGDPATFGKAIGGDIMCNKKTYMLINALNRASDAQAKVLRGWIAAENPDPGQKIAAVTDLYNQIGVDKLAQQKIESFFDEARACLEEVDVEGSRKQVLRDYTDAMMRRNK